MLSARQLGLDLLNQDSQIMSRQTTVDSLLLSVAAGQPTDLMCSNESTFLAKSTIAYCMHRVSLADVLTSVPNLSLLLEQFS